MWAQTVSSWHRRGESERDKRQKRKSSLHLKDANTPRWQKMELELTILSWTCLLKFVCLVLHCSCINICINSTVKISFEEDTKQIKNCEKYVCGWKWDTTQWCRRFDLYFGWEARLKLDGWCTIMILYHANACSAWWIHAENEISFYISCNTYF